MVSCILKTETWVGRVKYFCSYRESFFYVKFRVNFQIRQCRLLALDFHSVPVVKEWKYHGFILPFCCIDFRSCVFIFSIISSFLIKKWKKAPNALLSCVRTQEILREERSAEYSSSVLKNSQVLIYFINAWGTSFLFLLWNISWIARARTNNVGCVYYISTVHSCDVRRVLNGNIINSFLSITARVFFWTFYKRKKKKSRKICFTHFTNFSPFLAYYGGFIKLFMLELSATESHSWVLPIRMPGVLIPHTPLPPLLLRKNQSVLFVQLFQASKEPMTFPIRSAIPSELTSQLGSE